MTEQGLLNIVRDAIESQRDEHGTADRAARRVIFALKGRGLIPDPRAEGALKACNALRKAFPDSDAWMAPEVRECWKAACSPEADKKNMDALERAVLKATCDWCVCETPDTREMLVRATSELRAALVPKPRTVAQRAGRIGILLSAVLTRYLRDAPDARCDLKEAIQLADELARESGGGA